MFCRPSHILSLTFTLLIIVTKTVDKHIAKQIIAGENIIHSKVVNLKYFRSWILSKTNFPISSSKAVNIAIKGDIIMATQRIPILAINSIATTINGIAIAIKCHSSNAIDNKFRNHELPVFHIILSPDLIKDPYNNVNTQT
jgi:hypothetical protein